MHTRVNPSWSLARTGGRKPVQRKKRSSEQGVCYGGTVRGCDRNEYSYVDEKGGGTAISSFYSSRPNFFDFVVKHRGADDFLTRRSRQGVRYGGTVRGCDLAVTQYCDYQYCMVYSIQTRVRRGSYILPNTRAIVLQ